MMARRQNQEGPLTRRQFDQHLFDPVRGVLTRDGEAIALPAKVAELLALFLDNPNRAFSKEELLRCIWDDTAVAESSLYRLISDARQLLGDDPKTPRFIKTVPRKGYRWACPVVSLDEADEAAGRSEPPSAADRFPTAGTLPSRSRLGWLLAAIFAILAALLLWRPWAPKPHLADAPQLQQDADAPAADAPPARRKGPRQRRP